MTPSAAQKPGGEDVTGSENVVGAGSEQPQAPESTFRLDLAASDHAGRRLRAWLRCVGKISPAQQVDDGAREEIEGVDLDAVAGKVRRGAPGRRTRCRR